MTIEEQCEQEAAAAIAKLTDEIRNMHVDIDIPALQENARHNPEIVELQKQIDRARSIDRMIWKKHSETN